MFFGGKRGEARAFFLKRESSRSLSKLQRANPDRPKSYLEPWKSRAERGGGQAASGSELGQTELMPRVRRHSI